jgi:hypothetical protein
MEPSSPDATFPDLRQHRLAQGFGAAYRGATPS